ncbi:UDP-glycosyltransferase 85A8-like [Coffea eugenioides]|uniref:UDP-glycosyltransferase 85A8-like n=1 Tax=Coffea eugenioides TaxID=49369 RepID=UPI000F61380D|nr:UDP-glycosyltransferase 85A8-like [Coffea eugenioides]
MPPSDADSAQDMPSLSKSTSKTCLAPFSSLLSRLSKAAPDVPPVTGIIPDGIMSFTAKAAQQFGLPEVLFWTPSACGMLAYMQYCHLVKQGYIPLKAILPLEFLTKTKERGKLVLTSTSSKSSCSWRQQTNCRYSCAEWEMEINNDVQRGEIEVLVRELMDGEKGQKMRNKALDWKNKGEAAAGPHGQSYQNLDQLINDLLLPILSN